MNKLTRRIALLAAICICMLSLAVIPSTLAYIIDRTQPLVNTFVPTGDIQDHAVRVNVHKTVDCIGKFEISPENFQFALENPVTGQKITAFSDKHGFAAFELSYSSLDAGKTFDFVLYEIAGDRSGVTYSEARYDVQLRVHADGERATVLLNGYEGNIAPFRNVYNSDEDISLPDTGVSALPAVGYAALSLVGLVGCVRLIRRRK